MTVPFSYYELLETFPHQGCAVCTLLRDKVDHYLDHLLYERVTRPSTHELFRAAHGLCAVHGDLLLQAKGSALGIAILYRTALKTGLTALGDARRNAKSGLGRLLESASSGSGSALAPSQRCPACQQMLELEGLLLETLVDYVHDEPLMAAYEQSGGLCLPHVQLLMSSTSSNTARDRLGEIQAGHWQRLLEELDLFIEKHDYRRADDSMGRERNSWQRAVQLVSGDPVVFGVRRE